MKTVLVTGARGFVGTHLIALLKQSNCFIVAVSSNEVSGIKECPNLVWEKCDIQLTEDIELLLNKYVFDEVYHLAAKAITTSTDIQQYYHVNVIGTVNLLSQLHSMRFNGKILITSTSFVYGANHNNPINELTNMNPLNDYAASKAAMEIAALSFINRGMNIIIARPFNHTGPNQSDQYVCSDFARQFAKIKTGKKSAKLTVGNISVGRDFTDVRDIVRGYTEVMDSNVKNGVFNFCSGTSVKISTIIDILRDITKIDLEIHIDEKRLRPNEVIEIYGDYNKINSLINWIPVITINETLESLYNYWLEVET